MQYKSEPLADIPQARDLAALQAQMQRAALNANRDGGFELGWGIALLCFGLGPYFTALVTKSAWHSAWTAWMGFLPLACAAFAPYAVPKLIKRFITWPRTGYVANPNDLTLGRLVMLMVFGGALGSCLGLPFVLVSELRQLISQTGPRAELREIILTSIGLILCAGLTVFLGRKVIRKPKPPPAAYDAALITQALRQTDAGRKRLRVVRLTLLTIFVATPLLVCGVVLGLMYWSQSATRHAEIHWPQLGIPGFLVAMNALLYFMGSGVLLKPHRWKWLVMPLMVLAPILVAPAIPYPALKPGFTTILDSLPPVMLSLGAVWFFSGAMTLVLFMRSNRLPLAENL